MDEKMKIVLVCIAIGAAVGIALGVMRTGKNKKSGKSDLPLSMKKLIAGQLVRDVVTGEDVYHWFMQMKKKHGDHELSFLVGRITDETVRMFSTDGAVPDSLDRDTYLFLEAVDSRTKTPLEVQLVNCTGMDELMYDLLKDEDFKVINDR